MNDMDLGYTFIHKQWALLTNRVAGYEMWMAGRTGNVVKQITLKKWNPTFYNLLNLISIDNVENIDNIENIDNGKVTAWMPADAWLDLNIRK